MVLLPPFSSCTPRNLCWSHTRFFESFGSSPGFGLTSLDDILSFSGIQYPQFGQYLDSFLTFYPQLLQKLEHKVDMI